jgi:hypothetical protein
MPTLMPDHLRGRRTRHQLVGITQLIRLSRRDPLGEKEQHLPIAGAGITGVRVAGQFAGANMVEPSTTRDGYADSVRRDPLRRKGILALVGITARSA